MLGQSNVDLGSVSEGTARVWHVIYIEVNYDGILDAKAGSSRYGAWEIISESWFRSQNRLHVVKH